MLRVGSCRGRTSSSILSPCCYTFFEPYAVRNPQYSAIRYPTWLASLNDNATSKLPAHLLYLHPLSARIITRFCIIFGCMFDCAGAVDERMSNLPKGKNVLGEEDR